MLSTAINPQRNTKKAIRKKKPTCFLPEVYDQYTNYKTLEVVITSREWAYNLGLELEKYAADPETAILESFFLDRGITRQDYYRLLKVYPILEAFNSAAVIIIGKRRELGALSWKGHHQLNPGVFLRTAAKYVPIIQDLIDEEHEREKEKIAIRAKATKEAEGKGNTEIHVHMDQIPNSGIVPDKKKETNED